MKIKITKRIYVAKLASKKNFSDKVTPTVTIQRQIKTNVVRV